VPTGILVGKYTFEEGSGQKVVDSNGRNNHEKNHGARYVKLGPAQGFALNFDSTDASVDFGERPDFDLRSHLTLEMWVHPKSLPKAREIGVMGKGFNSYLLSFTGQLWFYIDSGSNHCSAQHGLDQWYHVVAVYDRQNMNLYLDGKLVDQRPLSAPVAQGGNFFIRPPLSTDDQIEKPWSFMLDDVQIYNRALSPEEVARHYQAQAANKP
jgi:hypothetical protein